MQVKGIAQVPAVDSAALAALADTFRPPRLNFAQVCLYCETRWCESASCIRTHAASLWAPCADCDGFGCCDNCLNGVVEVDRAGLVDLAERVLPRQRPAAAVFVAVA
ncbi:hypothetical protein AB0L86_17625 [Micromonospora musae]|uniref:hypothetical protein n=1 Tax=Micromonospora musae TaxID=1894970 RepID=UPI003441F0C0